MTLDSLYNARAFQSLIPRANAFIKEAKKDTALRIYLDKVYYYLVLAHMQMGNKEKAQASCNKMLRDFPQSGLISAVKGLQTALSEMN